MLVVVLVPPSLSSGAPVGLARAPLDVERDTGTIGDGAGRFCKKNHVGSPRQQALEQKSNIQSGLNQVQL